MSMPVPYCGHQQQDYEGQPLPCAGCASRDTYALRKMPQAQREWNGEGPTADAFATDIIFTRHQLWLYDPEQGRFKAWLWDCDEWRADREKQAAAKIKALPAVNWS